MNTLEVSAENFNSGLQLNKVPCYLATRICVQMLMLMTQCYTSVLQNLELSAAKLPQLAELPQLKVSTACFPIALSSTLDFSAMQLKAFSVGFSKTKFTATLLQNLELKALQFSFFLLQIYLKQEALGFRVLRFRKKVLPSREEPGIRLSIVNSSASYGLCITIVLFI